MVISAQQAAPARTIPVVPAARQQGGFLTLCKAIAVSPSSSHRPPQLSRLGQNMGDGESNSEVPEPGSRGERKMQNPDLARFNSPQNGANGEVPSSPVLGTGDKAENKTDLVLALEGLTEQKEKQSRPHTRH